MTGCQAICRIYPVYPLYVPFFSACHREHPVTLSLPKGLRMILTAPCLAVMPQRASNDRTGFARPSGQLGHQAKQIFNGRTPLKTNSALFRCWFIVVLLSLCIVEVAFCLKKTPTPMARHPAPPPWTGTWRSISCCGSYAPVIQKFYAART